MLIALVLIYVALTVAIGLIAADRKSVV